MPRPTPPRSKKPQHRKPQRLMPVGTQTHHVTVPITAELDISRLKLWDRVRVFFGTTLYVHTWTEVSVTTGEPVKTGACRVRTRVESAPKRWWTFWRKS